MTDKELTYEDVVEGLERCISTTTAEACEGCPFNKQNLCNKDQWALEKYALDLIKRQKSEIERLKSELSNTRRKALLEASSKFAGHSNYHGDAILCKLICMSEGQEVDTAIPLEWLVKSDERRKIKVWY